MAIDETGAGETSFQDPNKKMPWMNGTGSPIQPTMPGGFTGDSGGGPVGGGYMGGQPATGGVNVGHDGVYNGMNREQWRDTVMGWGSLAPGEADRRLREMGATEQNSKNGTWLTPFGESYDLQIGRSAARANGGNVQMAWTPSGGAAGGSGASGGGSGSGSGGSGGTTLWSGDPGTNDLMSMLWGRAKQGLAVNRNDPMIANARDAFGATQERSMRNHLDDLAERGGGTGNLALERRMGAEALGQNTAQYESQLVLGEVAARRQEIQNALAQMGQFMTEQQRMALQQRIADMDNLLARDSLGQRAYEFDTNNTARYQGF